MLPFDPPSKCSFTPKHRRRWWKRDRGMQKVWHALWRGRGRGIFFPSSCQPEATRPLCLLRLTVLNATISPGA